MEKHILVVDDDERLRSLLEQYLTDQGFVVSSASDASVARQKLEYFDVDAMVLDVMMPGESGMDFAQSIKEQAPPILMLTAMGESEDRIRGLEIGVDDYLVKPFEPKELVLRLKNIMKRNDTQKDAQKFLYFGEFKLERESGQLFQGEEAIYLTTSESQFLKKLAERVGQPVSREALAELTTSTQSKSNERSVDVQINRLRKKIEPTPGRPKYLQTMRGAGYVLYAKEQLA